MTPFQTNGLFDDPPGTAGYGVFFDGLWPGGESRADFKFDSWPTDLAPSVQLREWFHFDTKGRWPEFRRRYLDELTQSEAARAFAQKISSKELVTLLYASKDTEHNNAAVLREFLESVLNQDSDAAKTQE